MNLDFRSIKNIRIVSCYVIKFGQLKNVTNKKICSREPCQLSIQNYIYICMGKFGQFELNGFKRGLTHFIQLHISLDPNERESCLKLDRSVPK